LYLVALVKRFSGGVKPRLQNHPNIGSGIYWCKSAFQLGKSTVWVVDRIIWLPLRKLKGKDNWTVEQLLQKEYFPADQLLANALWKAFNDDRGRTLFILDGLDEMSEEVDSRSELLLALLDQPRDVITTRPYAINWNRIKNIDLQVETVGFYPEQVKEYIAAVAQDTAGRVQVFVESHPVVEGLARIPIQLDAICYTLEGRTIHTRDVPKSCCGHSGGLFALYDHMMARVYVAVVD
jgi:hypothetical protein